MRIASASRLDRRRLAWNHARNGALLCVLALVWLLLSLAPSVARAQANLTNLLNTIQSAPQGEWRRVNLNNFSEVWTPTALRPLGGHNPGSIIEAWSSFAWDSNRGELWLFGGGHADYSGNDVYRWRGSTQRWERASLPSEMVQFNSTYSFYQSIDGVDNAPTSAHTYDNNLFLPRIDRFITFGGSAYNGGGDFVKPTFNASIARATGPYLFDPNRADPNKVGGTTGSHVQRNGAFPEIVGGSMWSNRDLPVNPSAITATNGSGINHLQGMTAYAQENGKDVVYVAANTGYGTTPDLYRYVINDVNDRTADTLTRVGSWWNGAVAWQGAAAYDPGRKIFLRLGNAQHPLIYWNLSGAVGPGNLDVVAVPVVQGGTFNFGSAWLYGIDFDPVRDAFVLWGGGGDVWELLPPGRSGTSSWLMRRQASPVQAVPPSQSGTTGVLGKWKYASNLDAFVALEDFNAGNVWVYKPFGWQDPRGTNQPPAVTMTSPVNNTTFTAPATITLAANASDPDGSVAKVEFFAGTTLLATVNAAPYAFVWNGAPAGTYVLTARATDNQNASTTSGPVNVVVSAPNAPPTVALTSPGNNATFNAPATVNLSATAADIDGSIAKVEFFAGTTLLHTATTAPYVFSWTSVPAGSYALSARATDNLGTATTSTTVNISVSTPNVPPTVTITSPASGMSFNAPATVNITTNAADADGSIAMVEFFAGSTLLGTATTVPHNFSWTNVGAGTYVLTARATDNLGAVTTSAAVNVTVGAANAPPTVSLTSPANGATFTAPASIALSANATDSDGSVARVEFLSGTTVLATVTSAPYTFNWINVPAGNYSLSARATDNQNAVTTSTAANVTVTAPNVLPTVSMTSPANGAAFTAPATIALSASAADSDGSITKVEFYAGASLIATVNSAPYTFNWTNVPAGLYALTARATDNRGAATTSSSVTATVNAANAAPSVSLTSPASGATFTAPATIALSATAADSDGTIAKVEFRSGSTVLATVTAPPYSFSWTNVAAGSYTLTARATDNQNAVTTSVPASVTVTTAIPSAPAGLTATAISRTGVTLSWLDTSVNETQFRVQRSTNGRGFTRIATVGANVSSYTVGGLSPNSTYYFRVVATNAAGASEPSNVVVVRTLP